jgi:hypothetical protein
MFAFYEGNVRAGVQYVLETAGLKVFENRQKTELKQLMERVRRMKKLRQLWRGRGAAEKTVRSRDEQF